MDIHTKWPRAFALVDMVAFFASVEQLDFPHLRGRPVAVTNGLAGSAIITASYEARAFGIKTGTRVYEAKRLCPDLICQPSRHRRYAQISNLIMNAIKTQVTDDIEIYSVDECFLNLKPVLKLYGSVENIARRIRQVVFLASGGLRCTIGISEGKLTAKYAAQLNKGGTRIILPEDIATEIGKAKVGDICGIGKQLEKFCHSRGIYYCRDFARHPMSVLSSRFGNIGKRLYLTCLGHDPEPLQTESAMPKSMGHSKVLPPGCRDIHFIHAVLSHQCDKVGLKLRHHGLKTSQVAVGLRLPSGWVSVKQNFSEPVNSTSLFLKMAKAVVSQYKPIEPVVKVQIMLTELSEANVHQYALFSDAGEVVNPIDKLCDEVNQYFSSHVLSRRCLLGAQKEL